jgi:hypothetical protein
MPLFTRQKTEVSSLAKAYGELNARVGLNVNVNKFQAFIEDSEFANQSLTIDQMNQLITTYNKHLVLLDSGDYGSWPTSNNAIMKFQYQSSEQPFIDIDSQPKANILDIYCLVGDFGERTIISPIDGEAVAPNLYGQPLGWASYNVIASPTPTPKQRDIDKDHLYIVPSGGETCWQIAIKVNQPGVTGQDLADHNAIDDPAALLADGTHLRLPYKRDIKEQKPITYELLDRPKPMHVNLKGGTKKQSFGNAKQWSDIKPTGAAYPEKANVDILGIAYVSIENDMAAYYLDALSLGNYRSTGRVSYTIGFNHSHLSDGYIEKAQDMQESQDNPSPGIASLPTTVLDITKPEPQRNNEFKTTYVAYTKPIKFSLEQAVWMHDFDGRYPDKWRDKYREIWVAGIFTKDEIPFARPLGAAKIGTWYGIPLDILKESADVYNSLSTYKEKKEVNKLTLSEKYIFDPFFEFLHRKNKKNNKEQQ